MIFKNLSHNAKVWSYIANTSLSEINHEIFKKKFDEFFSTWKSHGEKINGSFKIVNNHFLLIAADVNGNNLCGRAVDSQVRFVKEVEFFFSLSLLDRNNMAFVEDGVSKCFKFKDLKSLYLNKTICDKTLLCNTFITVNEDEIYLPFGKSPFASLYFSS
tara:strand:+ start:1757 stop:2233 length:477 start_codon:yes stop_codon:yes gene_type:complete